MHNDIRALVERVKAYGKENGRHDLPWRVKQTPYHAYLSEIMLQQTQVDRVVIKFTEFTEALPTFAALASAPQSQVITLWQGLGYNRRALALHRSAQMVVANFDGELPSIEEELLLLPGVGPATAGSLQVYAYNKKVAYIETNIRAVYLHHFFADSIEIEDSKLMPLITQSLEYVDDAYGWYSALMDYGTMLKKKHKNPARKSKHHQKQSKFEGSLRQVRGAVIRYLSSHESGSLIELQAHIKDPQHRVEKVLDTLLTEKFLRVDGIRYSLK